MIPVATRPAPVGVHTEARTRLNSSNLSPGAACVNPWAIAWDSPAAICASRSRNACPVDTPTLGIATTTGTGGPSGSGNTASPRFSPKTVPPNRNSGTSDPTAAASAKRSGPPSAIPSSRSSPSSAAAAFADPAPRPPWMGNCFSIVM